MDSSIPASAPRRARLNLAGALRRPVTFLAAVAVLALALTALFAPFLAPYDYRTQLRDANGRRLQLQPPSGAHPLGTDDSGRDVLSRLIWGARVSLTVAVVVELIELLFGATLGLLAGYFGGRLDSFIMRLTDMMFGFPDILLAILITAVLGPSLFNVFLALALVGWPGMVRLVRGQVLALREKEFVEAARAMGANPVRIMARHLLPNLAGPIIVAATVGTGGVILAEATLSFLGLGVQPPVPSWGRMVFDAWEWRRQQPLLTLWPALTLALAVSAFNFLGDGLRDWLDPRARG